jgi:hypothetical protein
MKAYAPRCYNTLQILLVFVFICSCHPITSQKACAKELTFESVQLSDQAELWWARVLADINQDGITDMVLQNANSSGGWLGWMEGTLDKNKAWTTHIIAKGLEDGRKFAAGDLDLGDFDNDGDTDVIGVVHPGEWADAAAPADLFWFENPSWKRRPVGQIPNALKDINVDDLDDDGKLDIVAITFEESILTIFKQGDKGRFSVAQQFKVPNLHEGMATGDINGDGRINITTNGYFIVNPGADIARPWTVHIIDSIWNNQTGDWSRNASKVACYDFDGDGDQEVIVAHSERKGYPVAIYDLLDESSNKWKKTLVIEELVAAHNLQVADFDLDGDMDILTGVNRNRAVDLDVKDFPVYIILNQASGWEPVRIHSDGIYNALVSDYDGDGDMDIFRYPTHNDTRFYLMINQIR